MVSPAWLRESTVRTASRAWVGKGLAMVSRNQYRDMKGLLVSRRNDRDIIGLGPVPGIC